MWMRFASAVILPTLGFAQATAPRTAQPRARATATAQRADTEVAAAPSRRAPEEERPGAVAPTVGGAAGLLRMRPAEVGPVHTFRVGFHAETFQSDDFIVDGDHHSRFIGTFTAAYTPHRFVEVYLALTSASNQNDRVDPTRRDAEVILALGDLALGAKGQFPINEIFSAGPDLLLKFLNGVGGTSANFASTSLYAGAVASVDLHRARGVPFRAHLNAGYFLDKSQELCPPTEDDDVCDFSGWEDQTDRLAAEFGYGINRERFQVAVGVDAPFEKLTVPLRPIAEWHLDVANGDVDYLYDIEFRENPLLEPNIAGRASQYLTLGLRARAARGLSIDLASDIGIQSPGFGFGPATPPWNVIAGLSYAYDLLPPRPKTITKEVVKIVERGSGKPKAGRVRGRIVDAATGEPIEGAVVTFPGKDVTGLSTDPDGGFLSYDFPAGELLVAVRHTKYEAAKAKAEVELDKEVPLEVKLVAAQPTGGTFTGRVIDGAGGPVAAVVRVVGPESKEAQTDAQGGFSLGLAPGDYAAQVEAAGFLPKDRSFRIDEGGTFAADFVLATRPTSSSVAIKGKKITLKQQVHFGASNAVIASDSKQLLDEMVVLLAAHPEIRRVRIEGYTDNRGSKDTNVRLSQDRADSVRQYLTEQGVAAGRLEAAGYGPAKPVAPNFSARGREKNRRVEFRITD